MIPETLTALVAGRRRFLIVSHANPDGDAIGSLLGFGWELQTAHASPHGPIAFGLLIVAAAWLWWARRRAAAA